MIISIVLNKIKFTAIRSCNDNSNTNSDSYINHGRYEEAYKMEHDLIKKYLFNVYRHFYNVDQLRTPNNLRSFADCLASVKDFPFTEPELINYLEQEYHQVLELGGLALQEKTKEIYRHVTNILMKIKNYISEDDFE